MSVRTVSVRIGVGLGLGTTVDRPGEFGAVVDALEQLGFDSLWMSDRVAGDAVDPLDALAFAAGRTRRLKLGTNVLVVPGRDPFLLARRMATVDRVSEGRFLPAVGLGSPSRRDRPPFAVERGTRAAVFEASLAVMRELWRDGGSVPHPDGGQPTTGWPLPTRPFEVWFGGRSRPALERTGRLADGWLGSFMTPEEAGAARSTIEAAAAAAGRRVPDDHYGMSILYARSERSERARRVVAALSGAEADADAAGDAEAALLPCGADEIAAVVEAHVDRGITKFVLGPADRPDDWDEELTWLRGITAPLERRDPAPPAPGARG